MKKIIQNLIALQLILPSNENKNKTKKNIWSSGIPLLCKQLLLFSYFLSLSQSFHFLNTPQEQNHKAIVLNERDEMSVKIINIGWQLCLQLFYIRLSDYVYFYESLNHLISFRERKGKREKKKE